MSDHTKELSREDFIERLVKAGWPLWEAEQEWEDIQKDEEGTP